MKTFRADLHIHTVLSPCGGLDMSPSNIVAEAIAKKLDIIGITDHNSTKHCKLARQIGVRKGIFVMCGAEITTREEIHCLAFFQDDDALDIFQDYIDRNLPVITNDVNHFGYQVTVDENENILTVEDRLLIVALTVGIEEVEETVHGLGGIFIPAHINRPSNSVISQLGFLPPGLEYDALEINYFSDANRIREKYSIRNEATLLRSSDAHNLEEIGSGYSYFDIEGINFEEIKMALASQMGRKVRI
jgi:3',5'-nucleoside bisphosphate phosphatase